MLIIASLGCAATTPIVSANLIDFYLPQREELLFKKHPLPLLAEYGSHEQRLGFAAVVHSSDPRSPTFRMLDRSFRIIRPAAVILEGFPTGWGPNPARVMVKLTAPADPTDSYEAGEDMYAARLARSSGATVWGAEPEEAEIAAELRKAGFAERDIFFASMFGPLAQDLEAKVFKGPEDPAFDGAYRKWAKLNAKNYDPVAPLSSDAFQTWFRQNYARALRDDPEWFTRGGPGQRGIAGKIGRASNRIRDQHMFLLALRLIKTNRRVLVVAGGSHLSSQWRALATALAAPQLSSQR
ncbi:MAG TPA: hypothetical protein VNS11_05615 [Sphingomicrobium sp.]|nr:hypothetical protein [Sphingomicrobium sp.]